MGPKKDKSKAEPKRISARIAGISTDLLYENDHNTNASRAQRNEPPAPVSSAPSVPSTVATTAPTQAPVAPRAPATSQAPATQTSAPANTNTNPPTSTAQTTRVMRSAAPKPSDQFNLTTRSSSSKSAQNPELPAHQLQSPELAVILPRRDVTTASAPFTQGVVDFANQRLYPQVGYGVNWGMVWQGVYHQFNSLNEALYFLDQQPNPPLRDALDFFEELRQRYVGLKMQKEYGGNLLYTYAHGSNLLKHYQDNKKMNEQTKSFWGEAHRDRNKVTRHYDGIRRLVINHPWSVQEFWDQYILGSMRTDVLDIRTIETDFKSAYDEGFAIRDVMIRAEQLRWGRLIDDPATPDIHITARDIRNAILDLTEDANVINDPEERITQQGLQYLTNQLQREQPTRLQLKGALPLWGYVDERRQLFVPPSQRRALNEEVNAVEQAVSAQEQFEQRYPAEARPPKNTKAMRKHARLGQNVLDSDGKPLYGGKDKAARKRRKPKAKAKPKGQQEQEPTLPEGGDTVPESDEGEGEEAPPPETSGVYSGAPGGHGPASKRLRLEGEDKRENDLSRFFAKLSLRANQTKVTLMKSKRKIVTADKLEFPGKRRHPIKLAVFNKVKNDAMRYVGSHGAQKMSAEDAQIFSNMNDNIAEWYYEIQELFSDFETSSYSNDTIMMLVAQILGIVRAIYETCRNQTYATSAMNYLQEIWRESFDERAHIALQPGGEAAPGQAALTREDFESLNVNDRYRGFLTEQAILTGLLITTQNTYIPDIAALNAWVLDEDAATEPPLSGEAHRFGGTALILHNGPHWLTVTIDTATREFNVLDSAEWADENGALDAWAERVARNFMRNQFPQWFTGEDGPPPRRGTVRSLWQSNDQDCGVYVYENIRAFDNGQPRAPEVFAQLSRLELAQRFVQMAREANPDIQLHTPAEGPQQAIDEVRDLRTKLELTEPLAEWEEPPISPTGGRSESGIRPSVGFEIMAQGKQLMKRKRESISRERYQVIKSQPVTDRSRPMEDDFGRLRAGPGQGRSTVSRASSQMSGISQFSQNSRQPTWTNMMKGSGEGGGGSRHGSAASSRAPQPDQGRSQSSTSTRNQPPPDEFGLRPAPRNSFQPMGSFQPIRPRGSDTFGLAGPRPRSPPVGSALKDREERARQAREDMKKLAKDFDKKRER
jgi:Ulp1 protease family, C-terminal catalytic domain